MPQAVVIKACIGMSEHEIYSSDEEMMLDPPLGARVQHS
jgi:hypothetical protein